jgi:ribosomal protein L29
MTTIDLSIELVKEIFNRQNGLCALTGKKFDSEDLSQFHAYNIDSDVAQDNSDNIVLIWKDADFSVLHSSELPNKPLRKFQFQFGNFLNYSGKEKAEEIASDLNLIKDFAQNDDKLKNSIQFLRNLYKTFQSLNIEEIYATPLSQDISDNLKLLEERFSVIRNHINEESSKFYDTFSKKIDELKAFPTNWQSLRSARQKLLNIQTEISNSKVKVSKNTVDELKKQIANALTIIAQKQISERENYEMECSDNYLQLKSQLDTITPTIENTSDFAKIRQDLIEVQKLISRKTLKRNQQEELYQAIRNGFEILSSHQDKDKTVFIEEANANFERLQPIIENAITIATSTDTFKEARETLIAAQTSIKGLALTKEQRDELYGKIRTVFESINHQQEEERGEFMKVSEENFGKLLDKINTEKNKLLDNPHFKTIRENLLTIQSEIRVWKLKTDHRNKLYDALKSAFASLDEKRNSFFESQQNQRKSKSDSLFRNLKEKLTKLEEAVAIDKNELIHVESKLNEFTGEAEKETILARIDSINSMINEKEKRIAETKERIDN